MVNSYNLTRQAHSPFVLKHITSWRASGASKTVLGVDNAKSGNWRASVASETLTGVKMKKSGMFICIYVWTYVCHFVL